MLHALVSRINFASLVFVTGWKQQTWKAWRRLRITNPRCEGKGMKLLWSIAIISELYFSIVYPIDNSRIICKNASNVMFRKGPCWINVVILVFLSCFSLAFSCFSKAAPLILDMFAEWFLLVDNFVAIISRRTLLWTCNYIPYAGRLVLPCAKQALPGCLAHQYQGSMGTSIDSMQPDVPQSYSLVIGLNCSLARGYESRPSLACYTQTSHVARPPLYMNISGKKN